MDEEERTTVPETGAQTTESTPAASTPHTGVAASQPTTQPTTATQTSAPQLTQEEVAALVRGELSRLGPELVQQLSGQFASRQDLERAAQSASDKRFAKLMKELAPEMRGIDRAVQLGKMTAEDALSAKQQMLLEKTAEFGAEEEPSQTHEATPPSAPAAPPAFDWHKAGVQAIRNAGLTEADIPELQKRSVGYDELTAVIIPRVKAEKQIAQERERIRAEARKELEAQQKAIQTATQDGALTPPPQGGGTPHKKRTLADAEEIGDVLKEIFSK